MPPLLLVVIQNGTTAIVFAAYKKRWDIVRLLVARKADATIMDDVRFRFSVRFSLRFRVRFRLGTARVRFSVNLVLILFQG